MWSGPTRCAEGPWIKGCLSCFLQSRIHSSGSNSTGNATRLLQSCIRVEKRGIFSVCTDSMRKDFENCSHVFYEKYSFEPLTILNKAADLQEVNIVRRSIPLILPRSATISIFSKNALTNIRSVNNKTLELVFAT